MTSDRIVQLLDDPRGLEALYRQDPETFRAALREAARAHPDAVALQVWRARLEYDEPSALAQPARWAYAAAIALTCGALFRLPAIWLGEEWYYPRLAPWWVLLGLSAYFWFERRDRRRLIGGLALTLAIVVYVSLLPGYTDSVVMALIHLPILGWAFLGLMFTGEEWSDTDARIRFVRYNGELVVLASVVALGAMVFSGLTVALFEMIAENSADRYAENAGPFLVAAVPIVGTFLYDRVFGRRTGITAVLARIFAPLFLVMVVVYLSSAFLGGQNPFFDRSFLITFNGLLLVVLAITGFSIVERGERAVGVSDYINLALLAVTLLIDAIALSAILFRLVSFGSTPNRIVVLGANLVIMAHLAWMGWAYLGLIRRRAGVSELRRVAAKYLPVYVLWAALVTFLLPLIFRFA